MPNSPPFYTHPHQSSTSSALPPSPPTNYQSYYPAPYPPFTYPLPPPSLGGQGRYAAPLPPPPPGVRAQIGPNGHVIYVPDGYVPLLCPGEEGYIPPGYGPRDQSTGGMDVGSPGMFNDARRMSSLRVNTNVGPYPGMGSARSMVDSGHQITPGRRSPTKLSHRKQSNASSTGTPTSAASAAPAKRPANSWILYRQEKHPIVLSQHAGITNNEISKIVAEMWKNEPEEVKAVYKNRAEEERKRHRLMFPDYKYAPRKGKVKRKKKDEELAASAGPSLSKQQQPPPPQHLQQQQLPRQLHQHHAQQHSHSSSISSHSQGSASQHSSRPHSSSGQSQYYPGPLPPRIDIASLASSNSQHSPASHYSSSPSKSAYPHSAYDETTRFGWGFDDAPHYVHPSHHASMSPYAREPFGLQPATTAPSNPSAVANPVGLDLFTGQEFTFEALGFPQGEGEESA
ncbi:hypothetical protein HDU85_001141 [Gaertneriomyces sp. JEL0708]|nr:hypothetical protein HDU85_001141 [Gaertneriomyces sp. JEL0708]